MGPNHMWSSSKLLSKDGLTNAGLDLQNKLCEIFCIKCQMLNNQKLYMSKGNIHTTWNDLKGRTVVSLLVLEKFGSICIFYSTSVLVVSVAKLATYYLPTNKRYSEIKRWKVQRPQGVAHYCLFYKNNLSAHIFLTKSHLFQGSEAKYITDGQVSVF